MKRIVLSVMFILFILGCTTAYAHPPSDIIITYDPRARALKATIIHQVSNPQSHYIKKVDIGLNGKEIAELKFSRQEDNAKQTIAYLVAGVKPYDKLSVEAYCSLSGKLKKEIVVKAE